MNTNDIAEMGLVTGIAYALGIYLKKSPLPDWLIPFVILALCAIAQCLLKGWSGVNVVIGVYAGAGAIGGHQLVKQGTIRDRLDNVEPPETPKV